MRTLERRALEPRLQAESKRSLSYHLVGSPASVKVTTTSQNARVKRQIASTRTTSYCMAFGRNLADEHTATSIRALLIKIKEAIGRLSQASISVQKHVSILLL